MQICRYTLPVLQAFLEDPNYIGLRQPRVTGEQYDLLVDNFMKACTKK